ncbi:MAG: MCE family protein [Azospirillum sp.]|nr:MCE family protein [Azospirillum sp.]
METRARYLLVGGFVLGLTVGLLGFVAWIAKVEMGEHRPAYHIFFRGSVTGLKEGSPVRYRGLPVGTVTRIRIDPKNVERVEVTVGIGDEVPVKSDTVASLEVLGVTGNAYIQLTGGTQDAPRVTPEDGKSAEIPSKTSSLSEVFEAAPELMHRLLEVGESLTRILSPENERKVTEALTNLHKMSQDLAAAAGDATTTMASVRGAAAGIDGLVADIRGHSDTTLARFEQTLDQVRSSLATLDTNSKVGLSELSQTADQARALSGSLKQLSDELAGLIRENRVPVRDFTGVGLYELNLLIVELRELATGLGRVTGQIEKGPVQFLFGGAKPEEPRR